MPLGGVGGGREGDVGWLVGWGGGGLGGVEVGEEVGGGLEPERGGPEEWGGGHGKGHCTGGRTPEVVLGGTVLAVEGEGAGGLGCATGPQRGTPGGSASGASGWAASQVTSKATLVALVPLLHWGTTLVAIRALMAASGNPARMAADGRPANAPRRSRSDGRSFGAARRRRGGGWGGELGIEGGGIGDPKGPSKGGPQLIPPKADPRKWPPPLPPHHCHNPQP